MTAKIIDGKQIANQIHEKIALEVKKRLEQGKIAPGLAVVLVGENPASVVYVRNKCNACNKTGVFSKQINLSEKTSEKELLKVVDELNHDKTIHGILVQFPLPSHIDTQKIIERIDPKKDVDGFHPYNLGLLAQRKPLLRPCTPYGVMQLLKSTGVTLKGADALVVGASTVVGLPMALELLIEDSSVQITHIYTKDLPSKVKQAEILIVAAGKAHLIKGEWIKEGAVVIDVGINRLPDGKIVGDVEFETAKERASFITPVPGGVGPMTIAMLLTNTLEASK